MLRILGLHVVERIAIAHGGKAELRRISRRAKGGHQPADGWKQIALQKYKRLRRHVLKHKHRLPGAYWARIPLPPESELGAVFGRG